MATAWSNGNMNAGMAHQPIGYGAAYPGKRMAQTPQLLTFQQSFTMLFASTLTFALVSRYTMFLSSATSLVLFGFCVFVDCLQIWQSWQRGSRSAMLVCLGVLMATLIGFTWGDHIHTRFIMPHEDLVNLNNYPSVDPGKYTGQQLMDAGQIEFVAGSRLDLSKSIGFKNEDIYCVAPIVGPDQSGGNASKLATYDFWAVGTNCCSGHAPDYHCGEFNNPSAHKGLRLMRDDTRNFFRLAVQEASAAYNIEANHPVFMYWMTNPASEVNAYKEDGYNAFYIGVGFFGLGMLALIITPALLQICLAISPGGASDFSSV